MSSPGSTDRDQLERQTAWLADHWRWLLDTAVLPSLPSQPSALDVGSGPGIVASALSSRLDITCLDIDPAAMRDSRTRGFASVHGDAHRLPFGDRSFDVVYCSFVLLWLPDPLRALEEMVRTSRSWVLLLAEPDHGGRIDHPEALLPLRELVTNGMRREGADPCMGRKLRALLSELGRDAEIGIHPGRWDLARSREEAEGEWSWLEGTVGGDLAALKGERDRALAAGTLFHHSPVFYALARK